MEYFEKVYINSEADLPKEGRYDAHSKYTDIINIDYPFNDLHRQEWIDKVDWYLRPVEAYPKEFVEWLIHNTMEATTYSSMVYLKYQDVYM